MRQGIRGERLDGQPRLFGAVNQVEKEQVRRSGRRFETFVHTQMAGQFSGTVNRCVSEGAF